MVVVVFALLTVCAEVPELPLNEVSPAYVAVRVFAPTLVEVIEQLPVAVPPEPETVVLQTFTPSEMLRLPVGLTLPEAAVTVTPTV